MENEFVLFFSRLYRHLVLPWVLKAEIVDLRFGLFERAAKELIAIFMACPAVLPAHQ